MYSSIEKAWNLEVSVRSFGGDGCTWPMSGVIEIGLNEAAGVRIMGIE